MTDSWEHAVDALSRAVVSAALSAATSIYGEWVMLTGERRMPLDSRRVIRFETMAYCLHAMNRFAVAAGGPEARTVIQDAVATNAIREVFTTVAGASGATQDPAETEWQEWMVDDLLELVQGVETDYEQCGELASDSGLAPFDRDTVTGRLGSRISRQIGREELVPLRLAIWKSALGSLKKAGIKDRTEEACRARR